MRDNFDELNNNNLNDENLDILIQSAPCPEI